MVHPHDNDWLYVLLCDLQLWTKTFHDNIHVHHITSRNLSHHELTQDKYYCRRVYRIAVPQRLQPSLHIIYRMNMTIKNLLLQWLCLFFDILYLGFIHLYMKTYSRKSYFNVPQKQMLAIALNLQNNSYAYMIFR